MAANWIDLLDPSEDELRGRAPDDLQEQLLEALTEEGQRRPTLRSYGRYVFGVFLAARAVPEEDVIYYQELDVVLTTDTIVTVRRTPPDGRPPYDVGPLRESVGESDGTGMILYGLVDDMADGYIDLVDTIDAEIDDLEEQVDTQPASVTRERISDLRHDLLRIRQTLGPMRDAVRRVVDDVIEVDGREEIFPREVESAFNGAYDKLLRASEGLELSRDLLAGVRDYQQSKISIDQNEVTKRLTVIASLILVPTFIVGVYGQNFVHMPELKWHYGYAYSWGLIVALTLLQLWWFRRKGWL